MKIQCNLFTPLSAALLFATASCDQNESTKPVHGNVKSPPPSSITANPSLVRDGKNQNSLNHEGFSTLSEGVDLSLRPPLKEKTPAPSSIVKLHPAVEKARIALGGELISALADKQKSESIIRDKWTKSVAALPHSALQSSANPQISSGSELAPELKAIMANETEFASSLLSGSYPGIKGDEAIGAAAVMQTLASGMLEQLPEALQQYSIALPPTESDLIIFAAAFTAIANSSPDMANFEPWLELATAPNPAYRLIALRAARQGIWTHASVSNQLAFASAYVKETDPTIVLELVGFLATVPGADALQHLQALQKTAAAANNNSLSEEVKQALRTHSLMVNPHTGH